MSWDSKSWFEKFIFRRDYTYQSIGRYNDELKCTFGMRLPRRKGVFCVCVCGWMEKEKKIFTRVLMKRDDIFIVENLLYFRTLMKVKVSIV